MFRISIVYASLVSVWPIFAFASVLCRPLNSPLISTVRCTEMALPLAHDDVPYKSRATVYLRHLTVRMTSIAIVSTGTRRLPLCDVTATVS